MRCPEVSSAAHPSYSKRGCGNSEMSYKLYQLGYKNIVNVDYSEVVIQKMAEKYSEMEGMTWQTMDMYHLDFPEESFDCVLEKCTFEVLFCKEKSPWETSSETVDNFNKVLHQVENVLRPGGQLVSISFTQPHFRLPLLRQSLPDWAFEYKTFGDMFHYFVYIGSKGKS
ncbi:hypothetical protein RvY_04155-2 [Ramazzottius varieornatus]|uniref:Methyltransferase domain-containing protein n=1 Tax=Ramazzottius varieornatus TaxID=947166 RepID=A0A1D1UQN8_RAMVA|nr:hypothetical protein RvY_04155-2 [Ramazzottius varieornatus]